MFVHKTAQPVLILFILGTKSLVLLLYSGDAFGKQVV
jgi:hypothetical protein